MPEEVINEAWGGLYNRIEDEFDILTKDQLRQMAGPRIQVRRNGDMGYRLNEISRIINKWSRHKVGPGMPVECDPGGWIAIEAIAEIPELRRFWVKDQDIFNVVLHQAKTRFQIKQLKGEVPEREQIRFVRNTQGHSSLQVADQYLYHKLEEAPPLMGHGARQVDYDSIMDHGLIPGGGGHCSRNCGGRNHIFFSQYSMDTQNGKDAIRHGSDIIVWVQPEEVFEKYNLMRTYRGNT